ncbi:hypothetical protein B0H10DRAFT_2208816 [Mycena sp. CBHHK59/15]|nr:hypothetical protein B0H10DRAFT_2208816 [Mycena sp. CBHHK59/15]
MSSHKVSSDFEWAPVRPRWELPAPRYTPPPQEHPPSDDFTPYAGRADFDLANLLYRQYQMSAGAIDELMKNWAARSDAPNPPFADHEDLYNTIDATENLSRPVATQDYVVHFRDPRLVLQQQLANPDFKSEMDFTPKQVFVDGQREYEDFMSGNWAWRQAQRPPDPSSASGIIIVYLVFNNISSVPTRSTTSISFF